MAEQQTEHVVRLRPLPDQVPAAVRLQRALKCLGRSFGLRCVAVREETPQAKTQQPALGALPGA
jgi:hypothetical protein